MGARVLVTPRSLTATGLERRTELQPLTRAGYELVPGPRGRVPSIDDLVRLPRDVVGWLAGVERIGAAELDLFPGLRVISRNGVGTDAIDLEETARRGIEVHVARGTNSRGVAELALALILAGLRGIVPSHEALRGGEWRRGAGRELPDTTVGVVGYGAIGRLLAELLLALGARVLVHDPWVRDIDERVEVLELDALIERADAITLHAPADPADPPLIDRDRFGRMRAGTVLVNTARWSLVDPDAALHALDAGVLRAYAVDAFAEEPPRFHPILAHPGTILTPHLGAYTEASIRRAVDSAVTALVAGLRGAARAREAHGHDHRTESR